MMEKICISGNDCLSIPGGKLLLSSFEADKVGKRKDECMRCANRLIIGPGDLVYSQQFICSVLWVPANQVAINDYVCKPGLI